MKYFNKMMFSILVLVTLSGCKVETRTDELVLELTFFPSHEVHFDWVSATVMVLGFYHLDYSHSEVVDHKTYYYGSGAASADEVSGLLWHLGALDSYVTGTLSFNEIRSEISSGNPVVLQYGDYFSGHFLVIYGYDHRGYVYLHDPSYGTRLVHHSDLYTRSFHGIAHYWSSSIVLWD